MNEYDKKTFEEIKEKSEKDKEFWNAFNEQENPTWFIDEKHEEEIMERMFLVYYTEKYLELLEENKKLETNKKLLDVIKGLEKEIKKLKSEISNLKPHDPYGYEAY
jgi:hypothetical protein